MNKISATQAYETTKTSWASYSCSLLTLVLQSEREPTKHQIRRQTPIILKSTDWVPTLTPNRSNNYLSVPYQFAFHWKLRLAGLGTTSAALEILSSTATKWQHLALGVG